MFRKALICGISVAVTWIFFLDFCHLVYRCGCRSMWAGGAALCNIHVPDVPHCPWCSLDWRPVLAAITIPQIGISFWPAAWPWTLRLAAALSAFPVFGGIAALAYGYVTGYWK